MKRESFRNLRNGLSFTYWRRNVLQISGVKVARELAFLGIIKEGNCGIVFVPQYAVSVAKEFCYKKYYNAHLHLDEEILILQTVEYYWYHAICNKCYYKGGHCEMWRWSVCNIYASPPWNIQDKFSCNSQSIFTQGRGKLHAPPGISCQYIITTRILCKCRIFFVFGNLYLYWI